MAKSCSRLWPLCVRHLKDVSPKPAAATETKTALTQRRRESQRVAESSLSLRFSAFLCVSALTSLIPTPLAAQDPPRYLFFNIAPASAWNQNQPETFSRAMFDEVANTLRAPENPRLRVGVSFVFNTLETPMNVLAQSLRRLLAASEEAGMPVLVTLDGQNWWQNRPDLWNWWDPTLPGYNPSNSFNVEWAGWSPTQAVKIGWRN